MDLKKYNSGEYNHLNSSNEILAAIESLYGNILDEEGEAFRVWYDPTKAEIENVESLAKKLGPTLCWGC